MSALIFMLLAAFALMGSPGPATLSVAATGAAYGSRAGLRYLCGIITGTICVLMVVATGTTAVFATLPAVAWLLETAAAIYIVYLAVKIARAPPISKADDGLAPPSFSGGFALSIVNPKAYAAIGAVFAGHRIVNGESAVDTMAKFAVLSLVIIVVNSAWLAFGALISGVLRDPVKARFTNIAFSIMLLASVFSVISPF